MENIRKNLTGIAALLAVVFLAVAVSAALSDYTEPVYGDVAEEQTQKKENETERTTEMISGLTEDTEEAQEVLRTGSFAVEDGVYEGSAKGFSGMVKVAVTVKNGTITVINVLSSSDDEAFFNRAKEGVVSSILAKQSTSVDTVSGATYSSKGIINAVKAALSTEDETEDTEETAIGKGDFALDDGYYEGSGTGFAGKIKLFVEIKDKSIVGIYVVKNSDDAAFFERAKEGVVADILEKQTTDVDTVSGATYSSNGIIEAVSKALAGIVDDETYTVGKGYFKVADGTYEGSADGYSGTITVSVKVEDHTITAIDIVNQSDTSSYFEKAKAVIKTILVSQNLYIDTVSGATYSSEGIINAVKNALGLDGTEADENAATGSFSLEDGTYEGSGEGYKGKVTVAVTVKDKSITDIQVKEYTDDKAYFNRAKKGVIKSILKKQCTEVDVVSGATYSSQGLIDAVRDALGYASESTEEKTSGNFNYPDGIYNGTGAGFGGDILVTMVLQDKTIKAILVTDHSGEDDSFYEKAKTVADTIINKQSLLVDTVSGATYSSKGIIDAVANAMESAKAAASGETTETTEITENTETTENTENSETTEDTESTEDTSHVYKNGEYTVSVVCTPDEDEDFTAYNLSMTVVIENDTITEIKNIAGDGAKSNSRYIKLASSGVAQQIINKNGTEGIDTVSGATCSSNAIIEACKSALEMAKN